MSKIYMIQNLQQILGEIKNTIAELDVSISELGRVIEAGEFISEELNADIRVQLERISSSQTGFRVQYETLGIGSIPEKMGQAEAMLEKKRRNLEDRKRYTDAVNFFMCLHSEDEKTVELLEKRKQDLSVMDMESSDTEQFKEKLECYLWFQEAYYEKDARKKFTIIYKLASCFEEGIVAGIQFGTIFPIACSEPAAVVKTAMEYVEITENIVEKDKVIVESSSLLEEWGEEEKFQEEAPVKEDWEKEVLKEDFTEEDNVEESSVKKESSEKSDNELWNKLHIFYPDDLIVKDNADLLMVDISPKASAKFGVKEFKKDIAKGASGASNKILCLATAYSESGYTIKALSQSADIDEGQLKAATDKLYQKGYIKRYQVNGYDPFYCLTDRGWKAFMTKDAYSFIFGGMKPGNHLTMRGEHIEDTTNSAIARVLYFSIPSRVRQMNAEYKYEDKKGMIETDYFIRRFSDVLDGKTVVFAGIVSENPQEFKGLATELSEQLEKTEQLIILGISLEHARNLVCWLSHMLELEKKKISVWYTGYNSREILDFLTGKEVMKEKISDETATGQTEAETEVYDVHEKEISVRPIEKEITVEEHTEEEATVKEHEVQKDVEQEEENGELVDFLILQSPSEEDKKKHDAVYQEMLCGKHFSAATAYLKSVSRKMPCYESVYRQLAYALNDPMENCSYNSNTIFGVYYNGEELVSEYFVIAAVIRNCFMDQFSYDYSLQQLHSLLGGNSVLRKHASLEAIIYILQTFKTENNCGIDRYADYREKELASWEKRLEETRREAKEYHTNYSVGNLKENASHKRFIETRKLLLGPGSDLSEYLKVVIDDDRTMVELLEDFLRQNYVKDDAAICIENLDQDKINVALDKYWDLAAQNMRLVKKTSDLMSSLRMNLFKLVIKVTGVLCNYVFLVKSSVVGENDAGFTAYKKIRDPLLLNIQTAIGYLCKEWDEELLVRAGKNVLLFTLKEMENRLNGTYKDGSSKFFYVNLLRNDKIMLDVDYRPILDEVLELPELSVESRLIAHCRETERDFMTRLQEIFNGQDDYGSASLIIDYLKTLEPVPDSFDPLAYDIDKAIMFSQKDMENKRNEFIEDLELAQSYGQIDNTVEDRKEIIIQIMDNWYSWAMDTNNYGFFVKILNAFMDKIKEDAQVRAVELDNSLSVYLRENPGWNENEMVNRAVDQIRERIRQQNYAAAEDLMNRLMANDINMDVNDQQVDFLAQFLDEYEFNYRKTANSGATLRSLMSNTRINKDTKGAGRLIESWPKGAGVGENNLRNLLHVLGFQTDTVRAEDPIQGKIESYLVVLKRPENGRKSNYKHPISAFGSEAEEKGFRVVCIFGKTDAERLIDIFKEIGNAKNTLVLLDYALTLADRRKLARKTKTDMSGKIFAVIDRVVLVYLARQYTETAVNRMLMSVTMPFASYQPYIAKSADIMPQEIFIGRKNELEKIESPTGVNIVYGGRQLGKTALLRMAKKDIDMDENGDRAIIVNVWGLDYRQAAEKISSALFDEGFLKHENITSDWNRLARDIKNRLRDEEEPIPYFLLMIDEADVFIESCEMVEYQPFDALKDIQSIGSGRFKFVVAGLRNIVRFKRTAALANNRVLTHLSSLTVTPFKAMEARELLEVPLSYLGFRFPKDNETEVLISTIFGTTNYFPGLIQLYCIKLIEAVRRDYAGYSESDTPPYYVRKELIKKVLAEQSLQQDIREKFFITLKVGEDDYYYLIALLVAYHYHENRSQNGCSVKDLHELAVSLDIGKFSDMEEEKISALMEEMRELNVLQHTGDGRYRFARHSFCQMMGTAQQIDDELLKYMEE